MEAYAEVFGFLAALQAGGEADMPSSEATAIDETTDPEKLQAAAMKRNAIAIANLTMAFTTDGTMALAYKAKTVDWPNGLAYMITDALKKKYQSKDTMTRVELQHQLNRVTLKKGVDPATLFEQLSAIENRYNTSRRQIEQEDLIAVVIDAAPKEYQSVLTNEQLRLGNGVTLSVLEKAMNALWRAQAKNTEAKEEGEELVPNAFAGYCIGYKKKTAQGP